MVSSTQLFIGYTVFASLLTLFIIYRNFRFLLWKKTEGKVIKSQPRRVGSIVRYETYEPDLEYSYMVNGKEYRSNKLFMTEFQSDLKTVENVLKDVSPDKKVTVYYNPKNPSEAILKRRVHAGMVVQLIALVGVMLPFLFQAIVEVAGFNLDHQSIAQKIKTFLHSVLE